SAAPCAESPRPGAALLPARRAYTAGPTTLIRRRIMSARRALIVFVVLFAILGGAIVLAALAVRSPMTGAPASTVLVWDVPSVLEEAEPPAGSGVFDLLRRDRPTVWMLSQAIRHAAEDDRVRAMVLHVDGIDWGWAKVAEIRSALRSFR